MRAILIGAVPTSLKFFKDTLKDLKVTAKDILIGIDGGLAVWLELGTRPNLAIGDWDSLEGSGIAIDSIPHLTLTRDKDRSDLYFGVKAAMELGAREILCLGVSGGRPDHHLAMIQDLSTIRFGKRELSIQVIGPEAGYFFLSEVRRIWQQKVSKGQVVSVFALSNTVKGLKISGLKYPLKSSSFTPSSHGLSNEGTGKPATISIQSGNLLIIVPK